jgi:elongation factor P
VISTSDLKRGAMMELDGQIVQILSYEHQKIGRGSAQVRLKVKNIRTGAIFDTTAQAGSKWPRIRLDQRDVQYLYSEGDLHYVMDKESYEQFPLSRAQLGDAVNYLKDGMEMEVLMYEGEPVGVDIPLNVVLEVTSTDPGFKGDTATGGTKPATLETGLTTNVPLFVNIGDRIRVDTRDGSYIERV